jgi:hypothetical protein
MRSRDGEGNWGGVDDKRKGGQVVRFNMLKAWVAVGLTVGATSAAWAQAPGERSAVYPTDCNRTCLIGFLHSYMDALSHKDPGRAHFAKNVRFTENDVEMAVGDGIWNSVSGVAQTGLEVADPQTGNAAWFGTVEEHGAAAYYAMRLRVEDGQIVEVETVVDRKTPLPAPFGDPSQLVHDPAFEQPLSPDERRPRERLMAVANGYFSTVELNDGQVFTYFDPDCQRTENGISTTRGAGGAAAIAQGCEAQFKLGIYRINKRVRERRYPIIDEERGIVVGTGFFDHANAFDSYKTTDGKTMKTALKWPNTISLMEAFKIRNGMIYRVEAVFTYVPYFIHSPWTDPPGAPRAADPLAIQGKSPEALKGGKACDRQCLEQAASNYMDALVAKDQAKVHWAKQVRYTENSVSMMIGDGTWGTVTAKDAHPLIEADPTTGNVAWFGSVEEHGQPSYYALRLKVENGEVSEVEVVAKRKGVDPGPYGDPSNYTHDPAFTEAMPQGKRSSRKALISLADGYFSTLQRNNGTIRTKFDSECARQENGIKTTDVSFVTDVRGCEPQFKMGLFNYDIRVRGRRYFVDEERGVVISSGYIDHAAEYETYKTTDGKTQQSPFKFPNSLQFMEMFKIRDGKIYRVESLFESVPYNMTSAWLR